MQILDARVRDVGRIRSAHQDAVRKAQLLADVDTEIAQLTAQLAGSSNDGYSALAKELSEIDEELRMEIERQAEAKAHIDMLSGAGGLQALEARIQALQEKLRVDVADVSQQLNDVRLKRTEAAANHRDRETALDSLSSARRSLNARLDYAIQLVARSSDYRWLRERVSGEQLPTSRMDRGEALRRLAGIRRAAAGVQADVDAA